MAVCGGELGMPARELAKWDVAMIGETLLRPSSYEEMQTEVLLKSGLGTQYGLGVEIKTELVIAWCAMAGKFMVHFGERGFSG